MSTPEQAIIAELRGQRDALLVKVRLLSEIVGAVPGIIASARLDAEQGIQTKYDYDRAGRALNAPEFAVADSSG